MRPGKVEARRHAHVPIAKKGPETQTSWGARPPENNENIFARVASFYGMQQNLIE